MLFHFMLSETNFWFHHIRIIIVSFCEDAVVILKCYALTYNCVKTSNLINVKPHETCENITLD